MLMRGAMHAADTPKGLRKGTIRRVYRSRGRTGASSSVFLVLTMVSAVLAVSTPLLAGQVVDAIVGDGAVSTVVWLAVAIAGVAIVDAGLGLVERWQSSRIGEGLIYDLRRAVFGHVQRMPVAFFTRTRTGALVSRLNNDVMGAQRAFTSTLAGLVTNVIQLVLSVAVMLTLSWQVTAAGAGAAADLRAAGAPDGPADGRPAARVGRAERVDDHADDRAVLRAGRDAREAVRAPAGASWRSSAAGRRGCATSACSRRC